MTNPSDSRYDKITKQLDAMMDELMGPSLTRLVSSDAWEPKCNVYEVPDRYEICVELSGMRHEQIDVQVDGNTLRLSGYRERPSRSESEEKPSVHLLEIDFGRFSRDLNIPDDGDLSRTSANYRNGYLWIVIPKQ